MVDDVRGLVVEEEGFFPDDDPDVATAVQRAIANKISSQSVMEEDDPDAAAAVSASQQPQTHSVSAEVAAGRDPDKAARAQLDAESLGFPADFATYFDNDKTLRDQAAATELVSAEHFFADTPLGSALLNPSFASIASDDVKVLGTIQDQLQAPNLWELTKQEFQKGYLMMELGGLNTRIVYGRTLDAAQLRRKAELDAIFGRGLYPGEIDDWWEKASLFGAKMWGQLFSTQPQAIGAALSVGIPAGGAAAWLASPTGPGAIPAATAAFFTFGGISY